MYVCSVVKERKPKDITKAIAKRYGPLTKSEIAQGDLLITCTGCADQTSVPDGIWKKTSIVHHERPVYMYNGTTAVYEMTTRYHDVCPHDSGERYLYFNEKFHNWNFSLRTPKDDLLTEDGCAVFASTQCLKSNHLYGDVLTPDLFEVSVSVFFFYSCQETSLPVLVLRTTSQETQLTWTCA